MGTKKKINGPHHPSTTSLKYSQQSANNFHTGSGALRTRSPDDYYYRNHRGDERKHLGGVGSDIRLYNSCQTLMVTSPSPSSQHHYISSKNQRNIRYSQYPSNSDYLPINGVPGISKISTTSSFISASTVARSGAASKHSKKQQAILQHSFQQHCTGKNYNCEAGLPTQQRGRYYEDETVSSCNEDDYSGSGEDGCSTLLYDISGDDIHDAPKLNGGGTDYIVSRDSNISSKLPAYSIWRRQTISRQEKSEDYPRPFGSSASYYTSDSARALIYHHSGNKGSHRLHNGDRDSVDTLRPENATVKRKSISTTVSNSLSGRTSLARKASHRRSTKRRNRTTTFGGSTKLSKDNIIPFDSPLCKQINQGVEKGPIVAQKVLMTQVTRQVSIKRRKSMKRGKKVEYRSAQSKLQNGCSKYQGQFYSSNELDVCERLDKECCLSNNTKNSNKSSTLKSCRDMSEFETLPPPAKYQESCNTMVGTNKISSILKNSSDSKTSSKARRSTPKYINEEYQKYTQDGLFVNKEMLDRDKEYEEMCESKNGSKSKIHKNKSTNSSQEDGHGKVCCGGSACCNER